MTLVSEVGWRKWERLILFDAYPYALYPMD
jgi:hypothetical protein